MAVFQVIILLLLAGAVLSAWSRRLNVPYPALLALAGAGLALLPHAPTVNLDPELALALFVAPVLVLPGPYSEKELMYQAEDVASGLTFNASFNCNAAKLLVAVVKRLDAETVQQLKS